MANDPFAKYDNYDPSALSSIPKLGGGNTTSNQPASVVN
jgi:hypothetical protein